MATGRYLIRTGGGNKMSTEESMAERDAEWEKDFAVALIKYRSETMAYLVCGTRPSDRPFIPYPDAVKFGDSE
jgi:hypothetical protein